MKVLFIFKSENFLVPLGLCSIAAIAKSEGHQVYLSEVNTQDPFDSLRTIRPDIVAYSASTGEAKHYLELNKHIKSIYPDVFTIMGGPHPTFFPEVVSEGRLDAVCVGEGEWAFKDLLRALASKQSIENIKNIQTKNNTFELRILEQDLDKIPFPDYSLLYDNTEMGKYPLKNFMVSRGCPYQCTYCFNSRWNSLYKDKGPVLRRHSVDYVIEDILQVQRRWPLSTVKFYDDIFVFQADSWLEEFSKKYKEKIDLPFFVLTRADLLNEDIVKLLKHAGCRTISMSIEAGNADIRNRVLKRNMTDKQLIDAHRLCDKYGIYTFTNCVVGVPGTNIENDVESLDLAIKCKVTWSEFLIFHPYPGTELGDELINSGQYVPDYNNMHTSYMHHSPLENFSVKHQRALSNLSVLGAVATTVPVLRNLIVKKLMYWRHNSIFTFSYYIIKMYILRKKIYVTKTSFWESLKIFVRALRQEFFRHEIDDSQQEQ